MIHSNVYRVALGLGKFWRVVCNKMCADGIFQGCNEHDDAGDDDESFKAKNQQRKKEGMC